MVGSGGQLGRPVGCLVGGYVRCTCRRPCGDHLGGHVEVLVGGHVGGSCGRSCGGFVGVIWGVLECNECNIF